MNKVNFDAVNTGFGRMADEYDAIQETNLPVKKMREKYYSVVKKFVQTPAALLELNCGSGIDAHYFANNGYKILATDISDKMLANAVSKGFHPNLELRKMNFTEMDELNGQQFDAILSNLGGLNCVSDLSFLPGKINKLLKPGGHLIAVVMPSFCLWEFLLIFKGEFKRALRRMKKKGISANVGDEKIYVKYYSPRHFKKIFNEQFDMLTFKALRVFAPVPPAEHWYRKHPAITKFLDKLDNIIENIYPFSFIGDYYIAVVKKK